MIFVAEARAATHRTAHRVVPHVFATSLHIASPAPSVTQGKKAGREKSEWARKKKTAGEWREWFVTQGVPRGQQ